MCDEDLERIEDRGLMAYNTKTQLFSIGPYGACSIRTTSKLSSNLEKDQSLD